MNEGTIPNKKVGYPPLFTWPLQPVSAVKWIFAIPGYFLPWNAFYVLVGLLAWFWLSPALSNFSKFSLEIFLLLFVRNSLLVTLYFGAFHVRLYLQKKQDVEFKFNPHWPSKGDNRFMFGNQNLDNIFLTFSSGVLIWTVYEYCILYFAANNWLTAISFADAPAILY